MATLHDKDSRSFIESPSRGVNQYAREVSVGNTAFNNSFTTDGAGNDALNTVIGGGELRLVGMNTAILITNTTVTTSAATVVSTPLTNRNSMIIYNKDTTNPIYVGPSNVATSGALEGWIVDPGSYFSIDITDDVALYAIADSTINIKVMEMA